MTFEGTPGNNTQEEKPFEEAGVVAKRKPSSSEKLERETPLEKIRRAMREYPPLKAIILSVGAFAATGVLHVAEKVHEHREIRDEIATVEKKLDALKPLQEKADQLDSLFGNYSPFTMRSEKMFLDSDRQRLEHELSDFTFFEGAGRRSLLDHWLGNLTPPKPKPTSGVESQPGNHEQPILETSSLETSTATLSPEEFKELLLKTYPKGWVENEVASIQQVDVDKQMPEEYGIDGWVAGSCADGYGGERARITLMKSTKDEDIYILTNFTISHEIGHANDWRTDQEMTQEERIDLLLAVGDRLDDPDRYESWYVESIKNKDKKYEQYKKAIEYWAEICERYFYSPHDLNIKDPRLVEGVIQKADPQFDVNHAIDERVRLAYRAVDRQVASMKPQRP